MLPPARPCRGGLFFLSLVVYHSAAARIASLSSDRLKTAGREMLGDNSVVSIVVGDIRVIRPQLEELNVGPISIVARTPE